RQRENGRYAKTDLQQLNIKVFGEYSQTTGQPPQVANVPLTLSNYGTADASFKLADDAPPGYYRFEFDEKVDSDYVSFKVAAYRKPQVELTLKTPFADVKNGENVQAELKAAYYFGVPAGHLPINWTLYARPRGVYLPEGYQAGKTITDWYDTSAWLYSLYPVENSLGISVTSGSDVTDIDGGLKINIKADLLSDLDAEMPYDLTLEATLDDGSSQPVSARTQVKLHPANFYIGVKQEGWSGQVNQELGFMLQSVDWQNQPAAQKQVSASLQKVDWQERDPQPGAVFMLAPRPVFTPVSTVDVKTDDSGQARISFLPDQPGNYRLELRGEGAVSDLWVWIGGEGAPRWVNLPNQRLEISSDAGEYRSGQDAHIFIPNPLGQNALALITVERGKVMQTQVVSISDANSDFVLPVTDDLAPNVYVSVTLLGKDRLGNPDFRQGYLKIKIKPQAETLSVAFLAQPEKTTPGGQTLLALQVKDSNGQAVSGQFSLSLVDKAVLSLADPNAPDIVNAFYGENPLGVFTSLSLAGYSGRVIQSPAGGGRGGGGGDLPVVRQNFADTAFWKGDIQTDAAGMASVQVKLPDNLTTWVAQVRGLTEDTRVGEAEVTVTTSKALMIQPVTPRFAVVNDHLQLGAVVFNNTSEPMNVTVNLTADGFKLDENMDSTRQVTVLAMGQVRVNWMGTITNSPSLNLVFSAVNGELTDQTRPEEGILPILQYETPQTFATLGVLTDAGENRLLIQPPRSFQPTGGELSVELSPSLGTALLAGLQDFKEDHLTNNETMASALLSSLAADQAGILDAPNLAAQKETLHSEIKQRVTLLSINQNEDGGWAWQAGGDSQAYLSAYVLLALSKARLTAYDVQDDVLEKGRVYLQNQIELWPEAPQKSDFNRHVWMQYVLLESGAPPEFSGITLADWNESLQYLDQLSPWARALLALGLNKVQPQNTQSASMVNNLIGSANRLASGLYWSEDSADRDNFSSPNFNTAVVLYSLTQSNVDLKILNESAYYLMLNRRASGAWNSSYENAWVMLALGQVNRLNDDAQNSFGFSATLDGQLLAGRQEGNNNLSMVEKTLPLDQLNPEIPEILTISRQPGSGSLFYRVHLKVNQPVQDAQPLQKGLTITRHYELGGADCPGYPCPVVDSLSLGQVKSPLTVRLSLVVPVDMNYVTVEDVIPAGVEIINRGLNITQQGESQQPLMSAKDIFEMGWKYWIFGEPQIGDRTLRWVVEKLPAGTYELTYQVMPQMVGRFNVIPAHAWQIYYPEVEATSAGGVLEIKE
ncbi:MAG: hypothetical protein LWX83_16890, partial [Anaerolineae bacterium]|nr:hypothetical protein [Anaerolineae bacterium]